MDNAKRLHIVNVSSIDDIRNDVLNDILHTSWHAASDAPLSSPLEQTLIIALELGCKSILVQGQVQDPDYLAEYAAYYSKLFRNVDRYCHRLHFFKEAAAADQSALQFLDTVAQDSYLGFATIRPLPRCEVGVTILPPPKQAHFILSHDKFPVHIAGREFEVTGTPFMQQDNAVGACAQASIWMALRTLRKKVGNSALDPAQITSAATRFLALNRTMPNREGLSHSQMIEAVRSAGHAPLTIMFDEAPHEDEEKLEYVKRVKRLLYPYVESEIPVILGVFPETNEGHALLLIGHDWPQKKPEQYEKVRLRLAEGSLDIAHAVSWTDGFFVHNDNTGPYQPFVCRTVATEKPYYAIEDIRFAIPVLPNGVFMTAQEAEETSAKMLQYILSRLGDVLKVWSERIVFRTYLSDKHSFRKWVLESAMSDTLKTHYREKFLPQRVWITELSIADAYQDAMDAPPIRIGEIILDPTDDPKDAPFLSIHINLPALGVDLPGLLLDRDPNPDGKIDIKNLTDEVVYACYVRKAA